jgi:hypothetical protein
MSHSIHHDKKPSHGSIEEIIAGHKLASIDRKKAKAYLKKWGEPMEGHEYTDSCRSSYGVFWR